MGEEKRIKHIFEGKNQQGKESFDSYFNTLKESINKNTLEKYIRFEFLHKDKINGYYKDLFQEILGDRDFLDKLKLIQKKDDFNETLDIKVESDAAKFLCEYTEKIRNNIAHGNQKFKVGDDNSFEEIVDTFDYIIIEISKRYKGKTGFDIDEDIKSNILDNYQNSDC